MSWDGEGFARFFADVHGFAPLPWQQALAERLLNGDDWPEEVDVPTGLGKTALIDIALFASAAGAPAARRRVFFVVDRRLVVDQAHTHARTIADALAAPESEAVAAVAEALRPSEGKDGPVVEAGRMRGGTTWSWRWVERPDIHAVIAGTVDQIGSRLLMRGYGLSANLAPIDAALVGTDSLIVCDEAHLAEPFLTTLQAASEFAGGPGRLHRPTVVAMSATTNGAEGTRHTITAADETHPVAAARLHAPRWLHLIHPKATAAQAARAVVAQMAGWAQHLAGGPDSGRVVLSVCNTVARARAVFNALADAGVPAEQRILLTGRIRPLDRDHLLARTADTFLLGRRSYAPAPPFYIVSTQTVEVGANIDADHLVTESASMAALIQRLGRIGRAPDQRPTGARPPVFRAVVVHDTATTNDDPVYGPARAAAWELLCRHATPTRPTPKTSPSADLLDEHIVASPVALQRMLADLTDEERTNLAPPAPLVPRVWETTLQAWANTGPRPHPDPPVAPYLHGLESREPDVQVLWRADITPAQVHQAQGGDVAVAEAVQQRLQALPPAAEEMLSLPAPALRRWAGGRSAAEDVADVDTARAPAEPDPRNAATMGVVRYRGREDIAVIPASAIRPGDTIVLPASAGGCDAYGWNPGSRTPVVDVGDLALRRHRPHLRLHAGLGTVLQPSPGEPAQVAGYEEADALARIQRLIQAVQERDPDATVRGADYADALTPPPAADAEPLFATRAQRLLQVLADLAAPGPRRLNATLLTDPGSETEQTGTVVLSAAGAGAGDDDTSSASTAPAPVELDAHQRAVADQAAAFARALGFADHTIHALWLAGRHHDEGKRDLRFQAMLRGLPADALDGLPVLAKSGLNPADRAAYRQALARSGYPPGLRHEALSVRIAAALLDQHGYDVDRDLVLHLIGAHHGRARPLITPVPDPDPPPVPLPAGLEPITPASGLDRKQPERFARLQQRYGPWHLCLLEAVVRMADIWCSAGHTPTTQPAPTIPRRPPHTPAQPRREHTVALPALDGRDPLGFLAALGLLRLLSDHTDHAAALGFDPATATAHLTSPLPDIEALFHQVHALIIDLGIARLLPGAPPRWPPQQAPGRATDPLREDRACLPAFIAASLAAAGGPAEQAAVRRWLPALVTDLAVDDKGRAALTPFMAPAGRQTAATFFKAPLMEVRNRPGVLEEALRAWRRVEGTTGEYLDHRALRMAGDTPLGEAAHASVPGATWLATQALPLLRLTGDTRGAAATLWHRIGRRRIMAWPVWEPALDAHAVQALLGHPHLRPDLDVTGHEPAVTADRRRLAPLEVVTLGAAQRRPIPGGKSAGVLVPLPVQLR
ncbi:type I-U CRISPR-associated helicase/endonuclease Cas3 [Streptomonospora sp. PA3]|uniref:type I-G CRISPR-associated helicase/endonuclease Cas3g n=1 Tax=Streptomonospora sp. PA3 TaxID=2607326 RepID=UPI0012DF57E7|nr:type I-U CRISPR-associated helicase/endonuclease Cas3 [Streptomonospora sp. PA3]MUL41637.1 type I-U CRISPR-associated helicase/endonuclease Cas3 [Streptomonospora sp. PA3]